MATKSKTVTDDFVVGQPAPRTLYQVFNGQLSVDNLILSDKEGTGAVLVFEGDVVTADVALLVANQA